jgi:hypothetical protein
VSNQCDVAAAELKTAENRYAECRANLSKAYEEEAAKRRKAYADEAAKRQKAYGDEAAKRQKDYGDEAAKRRAEVLNAYEDKNIKLEAYMAALKAKWSKTA